MVVRTLNIVVAALFLFVLTCAQVQACFGPKLFVAAGKAVQDEALFALVTLYVQEKTGVESTRVVIETEQNPLALLSGEKADLVFVWSESPENTVLKIARMPHLVTGKRPLEDLQFTTVIPAIKKLNRLLKQADVELIVDRIEAGDSPMSVARKFLMELRWI
jgi:hypothetical protein